MIGLDARTGPWSPRTNSAIVKSHDVHSINGDKAMLPHTARSISRAGGRPIHYMYNLLYSRAQRWRRLKHIGPNSHIGHKHIYRILLTKLEHRWLMCTCDSRCKLRGAGFSISQQVRSLFSEYFSPQRRLMHKSHDVSNDIMCRLLCCSSITVPDDCSAL
jgi:hypothetical protein